ncbi:MAG: hypothetical protein QNL14_19265 [Deltaproteobacteria bacterium]|nr:hypothetical protein [Deltaproteobacteria bacterium]
MVDDIKLNRISPLLSSAESVKRVDRRQREQQQPPFKGALKDEEKKKKKKKKDEDQTLTQSISARDSRKPPAREVKARLKKEKKPTSEPPEKIIDIRV